MNMPQLLCCEYILDLIMLSVEFFFLFRFFPFVQFLSIIFISVSTPPLYFDLSLSYEWRWGLTTSGVNSGLSADCNSLLQLFSWSLCSHTLQSLINKTGKHPSQQQNYQFTAGDLLFKIPYNGYCILKSSTLYLRYMDKNCLDFISCQ